MQPICSHVGLPVVRICRLGYHQSPTVRTHRQAAWTSAPVGAGRQSVADEAAGRAGELEDAVSVGVGDQDVAGPTVDGHAVRALELTLTERVTYTHS